MSKSPRQPYGHTTSRVCTQKPRKQSIASFRRRMLDWWRHHGRRFPWRQESASTYERIVSELLLQRTRAEKVASIYEAFFDAYPGWRQLAEADPCELEALVKPLGLWQRRADTLRRLARELVVLGEGIPGSRSEIERLPGVGQYIANAIELFVYGRPLPLLDVNMARVLERYFGPRRLADLRHDPGLQSTAKALLSGDRAAEMNWSLLDLGATICTRRTACCPACPVRRGCRYAMGRSSGRDDPQAS